MDSSSYRSNRHASQSQPAAAEPATPAEAPAEKPAERAHRTPKRTFDAGGGNMKTKLAIGIAVLLVLVVGWWFLLRPGSIASTIDGGKVQAVFFTNGQVYFGKLSVVNDEYMKLKEIFYLQAKTKTSDQNPQETSANNASNVELVKLGSEIHGPEDEMVFSKSQVLFFENLKKDGNVSDTISKYKDQNN